MSTSVSFNGSTYSIPAAGEVAWAALSNFLIAVANNAQVTNAQIAAIRTATSTPVTVANTDFCVVTNLSVAGAVAVTLPSGTNGRMFAVVDGKGDAGTNNITISGTGGQNIGSSSSYVINQPRGAVLVQFSTTENKWQVLASVGAGGAGLNFPVRTATSSPVTVAATDFVIMTNLSVAGAVSVTLPTGVDGALYVILDAKGDAGTNNITVAGTGGQLINGAASHVIRKNTGSAWYQFNATESQWKVLADYAADLLDIRSSDPGSPTDGEIYLSTSQNTIRYYYSSTWYTLVNTAQSQTLTNKTLASPIITTSAMFNAQAELRLGDSDSSNYVGLKAPGTVAANKVWSLPNADGSANQVLGTDGSLQLQWQSILSDPMSTRGDLIYRNAANATVRLATGTRNQVLTSDGTDTSWSFPILSGYVGTDPEVGGSTPFQLTNAHKRIQVITPAGAITVRLPTTSSIKAGDVWTIRNTGTNTVDITSSNADVIDSIDKGFATFVALQDNPTTSSHWNMINYYSESSYSTTFQFNGSGTSPTGSNTIFIKRIGNLVTIAVPIYTAGSGTSSTTFSSQTAMPAHYRPVGTVNQMCGVNGETGTGATMTTPGLLYVTTTGYLILYRQLNGGSWPNSLTCGFNSSISDSHIFSYLKAI